MKKIEQIIHVLDEQDKEWKKYFEDINGFAKLNNTAYMDETKRLILVLMEEISKKQKQLVDEQQEENELWESIMRVVKSDIVVSNMQEMNSVIIQPYKNIKILRQLQCDILMQLLVKVFEKLSINYCPEFLLEGEEYGIEATQEFMRAMLQLDRIVSVHVTRHYDKDTAKKEFLNLTGFDEAYGVIYSELYEKSMVRIQYNVCLDLLEDLNMKMERLTQEVLDISEKINDKII